MTMYETVERLTEIIDFQADIIKMQAEAIAQLEIVNGVTKELENMREKAERAIKETTERR